MTNQSFFFPGFVGAGIDSGVGSGLAVSLGGALELVSSDILSPKYDWLNK
jgi:hypothetical protein